jgi:hypothetical protein
MLVRSASKIEVSCIKLSVRPINLEVCALTSGVFSGPFAFAESVGTGVVSRKFQSSGFREAALFPGDLFGPSALGPEELMS